MVGIGSLWEVISEEGYFKKQMCELDIVLIRPNHVCQFKMVLAASSGNYICHSLAVYFSQLFIQS